MKYKYNKYPIGGDPDNSKVLALDEALNFLFKWSVPMVGWGFRDCSRKLRNNKLYSLNFNNIEIFAKNHILPRTTIVIDDWDDLTF